MGVMRMAGVTVITASAAAVGTWWWLEGRARPVARLEPELPAVVQRMKDVARLETLDVVTYRKVDFEPAAPPADGLWAEVKQWARSSVAPQRGRAIVFADVSLGLDLSRLQPSDMRVVDGVVYLRTPPLQRRVALRPMETEFIHASLEPQHLAELLELARLQIDADVAADRGMAERARRNGENSLRGLALAMGLKDLRFADPLPPALAQAGAAVHEGR